MFPLSITQNIILFLVSGGIIWYFSERLSFLVEFINDEFGLGKAFGGTIILSIVTNLPEVAIVTVGVRDGDASLALGNILGGIALQTILLVLFDFASRKEQKPLSSLTYHTNSIIQGLFLCLILGMVIMGTQIKQEYVGHYTSPVEILIFISWIFGLLAIKKCEQMETIGRVEAAKMNKYKFTRKSALVQLIVVGIVILFFGVGLAKSSEGISEYFGISGVVFGATVLSLVTALPEISGGLIFVKHKEYTPIINDIFGGNSFLPVLFLLANVFAGRSILTDAQGTDIYMTGLSIILTLIFLAGMIIKVPKRTWGLGVDSWIMLIIYTLGIIGLVFI